MFICVLFDLLEIPERDESDCNCYYCTPVCQGKWHTCILFVLLFCYMHCCRFYLENLHDMLISIAMLDLFSITLEYP